MLLLKKHRPCTPKTPDKVNTMGMGKNDQKAIALETKRQLEEKEAKRLALAKAK